MKKQLSKLFGRKKNNDIVEVNDIIPSMSKVQLDQTPNTILNPQQEALQTRMTYYMKDITVACKQLIAIMKRDAVSNEDIEKFASSVNVAIELIQTMMGNDTSNWIQAYCAGDLGTLLCEQTAFPALLVEVLNRLRLHYVVEHISDLVSGSSAKSTAMGLDSCTNHLGFCMVGVFTNAQVVERNRCEIVNMMRMSVDLYSPGTLFIQDIVHSSLSAAVKSTFNAGLVWYLHDSQAILSVVETMRHNLLGSHVTSQNAASAASTFQISSSSNEDIEVQLAVSKALGLHKSSPVHDPKPEEIRQPELTYTLSSHDALAGIEALLQVFRASCRFTFVLLQDFASAGGYYLIWNIAHQDAASGIEIFMKLLPLGEGIDKNLDWTFKKCGAWNESAFTALKDYLFKQIEDVGSCNHEDHDEDAMAPYYNVITQVYMRDVENFKRMEEKTLLLTSLVSKIRLLSKPAQTMVLACVEFVAVKAITSELTRDILSMFCALFMEAKDIDMPTAMLLCDSLIRMLQQIPTSDHPLRETLLEFGLLDRAIYPYFEQLAYNLDHKEYVEQFCLLTCLVLHNHVAGCTQFRELHVHVAFHRVAKEWIKEDTTFTAIFKVFIELAGVTKSTILLEGIDSDVHMFLDLIQHCRHMSDILDVLLRHLNQYLLNNVTTQRVWRESTGLECLLSIMSSLDNQTSHRNPMKSLFTILQLLLESTEMRVYALNHRIYHTIADSLVAGGWLDSEYTDCIMECIHGTIFQSKGTKKCIIANAEAMEMIFIMWPHMNEERQQRTLDDLTGYMNQFVKPNEQKGILIKAGIFRWLISLIATNPSLIPFIHLLSTCHIPMPHLRDYLRMLYQLPDRGLSFLDIVSKEYNAPHASLQHHSYIQVTTEKVWPPAAGYSFACWFQFPPDIAMTSHTVSVPMCEGYLHIDHGLGSKYVVLVGSSLSIYTSKEDALHGSTEVSVFEIAEYAEEGADGFRIHCKEDWFSMRVIDVAQAAAWKKSLQVYSKPYVMLISIYAMDQPQCFTRVYFDPGTTCLRVETSQKHVLFKNIEIGLFAENSWHHLILTHRRSVMGSSQITLFIDGAEVQSKKLSYPVATTPGPIRCFLGSDPHLFPSTCIRSMNLGPTWLLSDVLPSNAANCMFMLGPNHMYSFPGNGTSQGAMDEWTESFMTTFLHWIIQRKVDIPRAAKRLQLTKLSSATQRDWQQEMVMSMMEEEEKDVWAIIWYRYFVDRYCSLRYLGEEWIAAITSFKWNEENIFWSLQTNVPNGQTHIQYVDTEPFVPLDIAKVLPSLGGLRIVLTPMTESFQSPRDLHRFLKILNRFLKRNPSTMAWFLEHHGYSWLASFLLGHIDMIDIENLIAIIKLGISGTLKKEKYDLNQSSIPFPVIVNVHAINQLLFHIILRNELSWNLQKQLVVYLTYTIQNENPNCIFNARQLRQGQVLQWWLQYIASLCRTEKIKECPELHEALLEFLDAFWLIEVHVDDILQFSDILLSALKDEEIFLRETILNCLLNHLQSSPVVARTIVDSIFYRLNQDRKAGRLIPPTWCDNETIHFSPNGLEYILLEIIATSKKKNEIPMDVLLSNTLLVTLAQNQPAFAMHFLVNSHLNERMKQVLAIHSTCIEIFTPLLAFVGLIPLSKIEKKSFHDCFPMNYSSTSTDRECIDAVWDIMGFLWKKNQLVSKDEKTTWIILKWLENRLIDDINYFQAICRSSISFLTVLMGCFQLNSNENLISFHANHCFLKFLYFSLKNRDDWSDNMLFSLFLLKENQIKWFELLKWILKETKILENLTIIILKNISNLFFNLIRYIIISKKKKKNEFMNDFIWNQEFILPFIDLISNVLDACDEKKTKSEIGDDAQQYFYSILVYCIQGIVVQYLYPSTIPIESLIELMERIFELKNRFLQETNGSCVLMYNNTPGHVDMYAHASGFRLHMRQLSLQTNHKEFHIGIESDKIFVQCIATICIRLLFLKNINLSMIIIKLFQFLFEKRMNYIKELLIYETKVTLLTKKETIDIFLNGFDQILFIKNKNDEKFILFFKWFENQFYFIYDIFISRTDLIYQLFLDTFDHIISLRHIKVHEWTIRLPIEMIYKMPSMDLKFQSIEIDENLIIAAEKALEGLKYVASSQREATKEAKNQWEMEYTRDKYARMLYGKQFEMERNLNQSVYQKTWKTTTLDATEGPSRKKMRMKLFEIKKQTEKIKKIISPISNIQKCLEFHDMIEIYRQCIYKNEIDLTKCKFKQTKEKLNDHELNPLSIADIISQYFFNDKIQEIGLTNLIIKKIQEKIELCRDTNEILPNTLFDIADKEAMKYTKLKENQINISYGHESEEDFSDEEDEILNRNSISGRKSDALLDEQVEIKTITKPKQSLDHIYGGLIRYLHRIDQPPQRACNAMSISGMQKAIGVFLLCQESIYFIEGFHLLEDGQDGKNLVDFREKNHICIKPNPNGNSFQLKWRLKYHDIKQFYRIKYQLRPVGLELVDINGWTYFCTFNNLREREDIFKILFQMPIHNSIYWAHLLRPGPFRSMKRLRQTLTKKWLRGSISNFDYLMELNALAGRTFNDLTQYPVFPWVLADYTSEDLDFTKPETFRDLSKPMGGQTKKRAEQFHERYLAMSTDGFDGSPAFHYGTHYSCSAYVTYYLLRLEPFASMAKELQGGEFDKADRLFRSIGASWNSASAENLQDVRELIPEFYFLPEFFINSNKFDFGITQTGDRVDDVILPPWARHDPREFIRLHRCALESRYVSENLHQWIDLIFGYKQRGNEAIDALNVFMHMTYEGTIDIDTIEDPFLREATLAQIENFGQTPSKLFNSPHPSRKVPQLYSQSHSALLTHTQDLNMNAQSSIEAYVKWHIPLAPPLVSIGKEYIYLKKLNCVQILNEPIGDVKFLADKYICKGNKCILLPPRLKKYIDFGNNNGSIILRSLKSKLLMVIENVHENIINCGAFSEDGLILITGGDDSVINILECIKIHGERIFKHIGKLTGHENGVICVAINKGFNLIVSGSKDKSIILWDLRTRQYIRELYCNDGTIYHIGINGSNGNILTIGNSQIRIWSINGDLLAAVNIMKIGLSCITSAYCTTCDGWQNGVVILTGHSNGTIACWGMKYPSDLNEKKEMESYVISSSNEKTIPSARLYVMKLLLEHRTAVTALTLSSDQRQLISGDSDGWCIRWVDDSLPNGTL